MAESQATTAELLKQYGQNFKGSINVYKAAGQNLGSNGFILVDNGTVLAAAYTMLSITLYQFSALERMMALASARSEIMALTDEEIRGVLKEYPQAALVSGNTDGAEKAAIAEPPAAPAAAEAKPAEAEKAVAEPAQAEAPDLKGPAGYERLVRTFTGLPGVIGSALVADGFPVYQHGSDVDFEHVAAATEDMVRAGTRIASELQLGETGQIILETPEYKVIIAPINDMFLCVLTRADTNLGLIRLNIRNAQRSQGD